MLNADQRTCSRTSSLTSSDPEVPNWQPWRPAVGVSPPSGSASCRPGHDCQHSCVGNGSSHFCTCHEGFALNADLKTCSRKNFSPLCRMPLAASNILTPLDCGRVKANPGVAKLKQDLVLPGAGTLTLARVLEGNVVPNKDQKTCVQFNSV